MRWSDIFIITGYIGACGANIVCEFFILRSNLYLGVIEGKTCRLSGISALKILLSCSRARNCASPYRAKGDTGEGF